MRYQTYANAPGSSGESIAQVSTQKIDVSYETRYWCLLRLSGLYNFMPREGGNNNYHLPHCELNWLRRCPQFHEYLISLYAMASGRPKHSESSPYGTAMVIPGLDRAMMPKTPKDHSAAQRDSEAAASQTTLVSDGSSSTGAKEKLDGPEPKQNSSK